MPLLRKENGFFKGCRRCCHQGYGYTIDPANWACNPSKPWGSLGEKIWGFSWEWLGRWLGDSLELLKQQAQLDVFETKARFTQWWIP